MKKYGLQLRVQQSQPKKQPTRPTLPTPLGFRDDDEDDVEREISRQATKNKALKDVEEQHRKALAEDPSVFDYDGVYDEMKEKSVRPVVHDRQERKPKYIQALIEKAKVREREHEIIYERKIAKERMKDDHLYVDKDKFVTSGYKKKLAEQAKWQEEERLRQLHEEKEDVTKKDDLSDFYFSLSKNVAFGAREAESKASQKQPEEVKVHASETSPAPSTSKRSESPSKEESRRFETSSLKEVVERTDIEPVSDSSVQGDIGINQVSDQVKTDHHKRSADAVAAAKERFLARKREKHVY